MNSTIHRNENLTGLIKNEADLGAVCLKLIGDTTTLSDVEQRWMRQLPQRASTIPINRITAEILSGMDPLGTAFAEVRTEPNRRKLGQTNTPPPFVDSMLRWVADQTCPCRFVDLGAGSGRFTLAAAKAFPKAEIIAVEADPLAALMLRANITIRGYKDRATILVDDYRNITLRKTTGATAFIGNPPYVRHHGIDKHWKNWYQSKFAGLEIPASGLAGLHLHFFLKTFLLSQTHDVGCIITASEWLDVNYGSALRQLLMTKLGATGIHVLEPTVEAFPGTASTAAITCFRIGSKDPVKVRFVSKLPKLNNLSHGVEIPQSRLLAEPRWSIIIRGKNNANQIGIPLGDLFHVHRGQVTGLNSVWIAGEQARQLPESVLVPTVTKAKELINAGKALSTTQTLRRIVDLPTDLSQFTSDEQSNINKFLEWARREGADQTYTARHRKAWWAVGLKPPAPILCTYMARRAPQFTVNQCQARHINIAHGLYPIAPIDLNLIPLIVNWLNKNVLVSSGRTYAGGLTKFEPKEIERIHIPKLEELAKS